MKYHAFVPKGRRYAEVIVTKAHGKASTQTETGETFPTFAAAEQAVADRNLAISRDRYGR